MEGQEDTRLGRGHNIASGWRSRIVVSGGVAGSCIELRFGRRSSWVEGALLVLGPAFASALGFVIRVDAGLHPNSLARRKLGPSESVLQAPGTGLYARSHAPTP